MLETKRPTPVLSLFTVTQTLRGKLEPGERPMFGLKQNLEGGVMSFHEFIHTRLISNPEAIWVAAVERTPRLQTLCLEPL